MIGIAPSITPVTSKPLIVFTEFQAWKRISLCAKKRDITHMASIFMVGKAPVPQTGDRLGGVGDNSIEHVTAGVLRLRWVLFSLITWLEHTVPRPFELHNLGRWHRCTMNH